MLVNADVKSLEVVVAAELSKDTTLSQELINKVDIHDANRVAFNLGDGKDGRLIAKIFKFRLIYGGSAYSYANDPDFQKVSSSEKFWQEVIDKYYTKYQGIRRWHQELIREAQSTGKLTIPSGRYYPITPDYSKKEPWPLTIIKNYPVQGFGSDLVMLARLEVRKRLLESGYRVFLPWGYFSGNYKPQENDALLISTIHDSIVVDTPKQNAEHVGRILYESIASVPSLCKKVFNYDFKLPLTSEVQIGPNKKEMVELKFDF